MFIVILKHNLLDQASKTLTALPLISQRIQDHQKIPGKLRYQHRPVEEGRELVNGLLYIYITTYDTTRDKLPCMHTWESILIEPYQLIQANLKMLFQALISFHSCIASRIPISLQGKISLTSFISKFFFLSLIRVPLFLSFLKVPLRA